MKTILFVLTLLSAILQAEVINQPAGTTLLSQNMPVIDIRTPGEWKETGLLKGAIPIMFFDENGGYNVETFMKALNAHVDTSKPYALICRTGSRTSMVANFLAKTYGHTVINLQGGMVRAKSLDLPILPYTGQ